MISLLCDFGFVPMTSAKWDKVLNKWISNSRKYDTLNKPERLEVLGKLKESNKYKAGSDDFSFLTKKSIDNNSGKKSKRTVGIVDIHHSPTTVQIPYLVGNPLSNKDPKFKGAIESLNTRLTIPRKKGKKLMIDGINTTVNQMYKDKFKDMM